MVGSLFTQVGCTRTLLGVLLAPEAVVSSTAGNVVGAGAETLSGMSVEQLANLESTAMEIDKLIANDPNSASARRLRELQEKLRGMPKNTGPDQRVAAQGPPPPRRAMNKPLPLRHGDLLSVKKPSNLIETRRPPMRPNTQPSSTTLKPDNVPVHMMSITPVRIQ